MKPNGPATTLGRVSTPEALESAIRDLVLSQAIPPGSPVREAEIASQYGVGRNSVRAALQRLVHTGLLRHEQNRGAFVPTFTESDVHDLFQLRRAIELEAVSTVVTQSMDLSAINEALARLKRVRRRADWIEAVRTDLELHATIVRTASSGRMARLYDGLVSELLLLLVQLQHIYPAPGTLGPIHGEIVAALRDGDEGRARAIVKEHLDKAEGEVVDAIGKRTLDAPSA